MKKLLFLASLISTPVHAAFDLEGMLEDIVEEGVKTVISEVAGPKSSLSAEELVKLVASNDKKVQKFLSENHLDHSQRRAINTMAVGCENYRGKYAEAEALCKASNQLSIAESNMDKVNEISLLYKRINTNINKHNRYIDSFGRDDINQVEVIITDSKLLEAKLNEYEKYRTYPSVPHVIANGEEALSIIKNKQAKIALNKRQADNNRKIKASKVAQAQRQAEIKAGLPLVTNGIFKKPYTACLAEGEKLIDMTKLLDSKAMAPEKVKEARATFKEQCGCIYVTIQNNSENASKSGRRALADDLTKLEKAKVKNSERKMSKWEARKFRDGFNNANVMHIAYMDAALKCD